MTDEMELELCKKYEDGASRITLRKEYDISDAVCKSILIKHNIAIRSKPKKQQKERKVTKKKREYLDRMYGVGNWKILTKDEFIELFNLYNELG